MALPVRTIRAGALQTRMDTANQFNLAPPPTALADGVAEALLDKLGPALENGEPAWLVMPSRGAGINSVPVLRRFLLEYRERLLLPLELPVILQARALTEQGAVRDLIELDRHLGTEVSLKELAAASFRVGQRQLHRLRPLRDHRVVQRYLRAVDAGEAHGWHTVVYGLFLGVYALPLRQGLLHYASQALGGFVDRAAGSLALTHQQSQELHEEAFLTIPKTVQTLLAPQGQPPLRVV